MIRYCLLVSFLASSAFGDGIEEARQHYRRATRAYEVGQYDEAIQEFVAAYKIKDDPPLLFNIAQSYRLTGHPAEALRFYKLFLIKMPGATNHDDVVARIAVMQQLIEEQKKPQRPPFDQVPPFAIKPQTVKADRSPGPNPALPGTSLTATAPTATASATPPPLPTAIGNSSARALRAGRKKKIWGGTVTGFGLALTAVGIVFAMLAKDASDQLTSTDKMHGTYDASVNDTGERDQLIGGVFLGVGGASTLAGLIVIGVGAHEARVASRPSLRASAGGLEVAF